MGRLNVLTKILIRERGRQGRGELEDASLMALKTEHETMRQGMQKPVGAQKGKETVSSLGWPYGLQCLLLAHCTDFELQTSRTVR